MSSVFLALDGTSVGSQVVQTLNDSGQAVPVSVAFPLPVEVIGGGSSGSSGGSVSGVGVEVSTFQPALLTLLDTFTVTNPGQYYVQNQSGETLQVVYDDGQETAGTVSIQLLGPGPQPNAQGDDTGTSLPWFTGRIRVYGTESAQHMARHN